MTTTIFGDAGTFTLDDATAPEVVFPANGEPVDAAAVATGAVQTVADYIARVATEAKLEKLYGVGRIITFASIASLRAHTGMTERDVVMLFSPTYTGGSGGLLGGFGLFVFKAGATWPQTATLGGTYLVVEPDDGTGRWVNLAAGVGWNIGASPTFQPPVAERNRQWHAELDGSGSYAAIAGAAPAYVGTDIVLATGLPQGASIALDFDFSMTSDDLSNTVNAQIEVSSASISGGTWTRVGGSRKAIGGTGAIDDVFVPVHLGGFLTAPNNDTYDFRVALLLASGKTATVLRQWSARGLSYSAT